MRVLLVCNYYQPQLGYAESQIAAELKKAGHLVRVVTGNRYFPFPDFERSVGSVLGSRMTPVGTRQEKGITVERKPVIFELFARSYFTGFAETVAGFQPDLVIVFGISTPSCVQMAQLKKQFSYRLVAVDSHLPSELERGSIWVKQVFYAWFRYFWASFISRQLDAVIAVQEGTIGVITNTYGVAKKPHLISHGTDTTLFKPDLVLRKKNRLKLGYYPKNTVIIYTGKVIEAKGVLLLCQAFNTLAAKYPQARLLIVGSGAEKYQQKCLQAVDAAHHEKVHWAGFQPQTKLPQYYNAADIAVWPLQESLAMNDAAACGLPIIVNHTIAAKERLSNHNAVLYKKGEARDLAKKIAVLIKDPKRRKEMGRRGRQLMEKKLSWKAVAERYLATVTQSIPATKNSRHR